MAALGPAFAFGDSGAQPLRGLAEPVGEWWAGEPSFDRSGASLHRFPPGAGGVSPIDCAVLTEKRGLCQRHPHERHPGPAPGVFGVLPAGEQQ